MSSYSNKIEDCQNKVRIFQFATAFHSHLIRAIAVIFVHPFHITF